MARRLRWAALPLLTLIALVALPTAVAGWTIATRNPGTTFATGSLQADTNLATTKVTGNGKVTFGWTVPAAQFQGTFQSIYLSTGGGAYTLYSTVGPTVTSTTVQGYHGMTYCIEVSQDAGTNWSAMSSPLCGSVP